MARLVVIPGSCGYNIEITVLQDGGGAKRYTLAVETDCEYVKLLAQDLPTLDMTAAFTAIAQNPVYRAASMRLKHAACPVPSGILKALEVEAGLNVPKDVFMLFFDKKRRRHGSDIKG